MIKNDPGSVALKVGDNARQVEIRRQGATITERLPPAFLTEPTDLGRDPLSEVEVLKKQEKMRVMKTSASDMECCLLLGAVPVEWRNPLAGWNPWRPSGRILLKNEEPVRVSALSV